MSRVIVIELRVESDKPGAALAADMRGAFEVGAEGLDASVVIAAVTVTACDDDHDPVTESLATMVAASAASDDHPDNVVDRYEHAARALWEGGLADEVVARAREIGGGK